MRQMYAQDYCDTIPHKDPLPPHIFQLANSSDYHMKYHAIILSCVPSSLPITTERLSPGKQGSKLGTQVPASEFILESFARTLFNP
ncbi:hypothetical protein B0H16DRAFT_1247666, partial [Mycena metata]